MALWHSDLATRRAVVVGADFRPFLDHPSRSEEDRTDLLSHKGCRLMNQAAGNVDGC